MSSEWAVAPLGDVVSFKTGKLDSNAAEKNGQFPFFTCSPTTLSINSYAFDTEAVILAGNNANGVFSTKHYSGKFNAYQRTYVIEPIDEETTSCRYIYFVISHMVGNLRELSIGSATKFLTKTILNALPVPIPPKVEQDEIALMLSALDDRITLLRETNATLEAIAQALFKSWFVDFDPVRAKMAGRTPEGMDEATAALFPDGLEESELGLVPRGWRVMLLGEMCAVTIGGLWGNDERDDAELTPAISLRGVDLEHLRVRGFASNAPMRWVKPSAMEKRRLGENEVLIASSGAGPCGRPLWAGAGFELLYGMPVIFSNFVKRLDCGSPARAIYVDRLLAEMRATREIWNYINGTSIPNLDDKLLLATKKVVVPDHAVLSEFESVARAIYKRLYSQEAQTLSTLRDTLLPRLISGQLRLPEADAALEVA